MGIGHWVEGKDLRNFSSPLPFYSFIPSSSYFRPMPHAPCPIPY
ncbi:MAG: hypothetical protein V7K98_08975 [Nostoc sp.]